MGSNDNTNSLKMEDAEKEVRLASRRIALLHLAYARTLEEKLGEKGLDIAAAAIKEYGKMIGKEVKEKVLDAELPLTPGNYGAGSSRNLPKIGMHEGVKEYEERGQRRIISYGCEMAKVWAEYDENQLGRLYCYVDPAKYMAYNPEFKLAHIKAMPDGDDCCEFCVAKTTEDERQAFESEDSDWLFIDQCEEE